MKIRIHKNAIRLRLSQTEVNQLGQGNDIIEELRFPAPYPSLVYALKIKTGAEVTSVSHESPNLLVHIPASKIKIWASSNQVGIAEDIPLDNEQTLRVLVEKDFQCLNHRPNEDEKDNFPNPQA